MKRLYLAFTLLCLSACLQAQTITSVSGTVTDGNGVPYANGTIIPQFVNVSGGATPTITATSAPVYAPTTPVILSSTGTFTIGVLANGSITPSSTHWQFLICSAAGSVPQAGGTGSACFTTGLITISGATQSITSSITSASPPALTVIATTPNLTTAGVVNFSSDTGLSRDSAGVVDVGTGAQGSSAGTVKLLSVIESSLGLVTWNADTGLSRDSAGVIDVGTGAQGSSAATIKLLSVLESSLGLVTWNADTGLSRISAGVIGAGTGAQGSVAGTYEGAVFSTATANPAASGVVRLATTDTLCLRNAANGADVCASDTGAAAAGNGNIADVLNYTPGLQSAAFVDRSAAPAQSGVLRTGNAVTAIAARNAAGNADLALLGSNASNQATVPTIVGAYQGVAKDTNHNGFPFTIASAVLTAQAANVTATSLVASATAGRYRLSCYIAVTQQATTTATVPNCNMVCTDATDSVAKTIQITPAIAGVVANPTTAVAESGDGICDAKTATAIQYSTSNYASVGATPMQFKIYVVLESL